MGNSLSLAASMAVPIVVGAGIGVSLSGETRGSWYKGLKKPSWNPPNWIFGPVWTTLYAAMGYASWRVAQAGGGPLPLGLYGVQLLANFLWSPIFFKWKNLKAAAAEITVLLGLVGATIWEFSKVDTVAAQLLLPYLGWSSFATVLTYWIWLHNDEEGKAARRAVRQAGEDVADRLAGAAAGAKETVQVAGDAVHGGAAEATAQAAQVFLAQGGETQADSVPPEAAAATAARSSAARKED